MGIEQLVDSFLGNPKPLEAKVERDNKGQPPGAIPKDLEEAIALQKIAELQKGAQNQQAMQAGGAQPSVVQKLQQMLAMAQQRQQAQMPQQMPGQMPQGTPRPMFQQPVMAASGGSLDQLASNLARHYAGGGIVAFNGEEENNPVEDPAEAKRSLIERLLYSNITPAEKARRHKLELLANANQGESEQAAPESLTPQQMEAFVKAAPMDAFSTKPSSGLRQVTQRELAEEYNRKRWAQQAEDAAQPKESWGSTLEKLLYSNITPAEQQRRAALQTAADNRMLERNPSMVAPDSEVEKLKRLAAARVQPGITASPSVAQKPQSAGPAPEAVRVRPNVAGADTAPAAQQAPSGLRAAIEANILKELGKDEDVEWQKGAKRHEEFMGLDKLLQPKEASIAEQQALIKKMQSERLPAWVEGFSRASKPIVAGGLGTMLNNLGSGMQGQREAYDAQDLSFLDKIGKMQDEVAKLKMEGKYKAAAAGEASIKDAIANKRQAESSGTSLLNTDEMAATRRQMAKDAAAARVAAAAARGDTGADKQRLAELKALQASYKEELKLPSMMGKAGEDTRRKLAAVNAAIAQMAGLDTMAAAPGAAGPGGTSKPGWGIKPIQ